MSNGATVRLASGGSVTVAHEGGATPTITVVSANGGVGHALLTLEELHEVFDNAGEVHAHVKDTLAAAAAEAEATPSADPDATPAPDDGEVEVDVEAGDPPAPPSTKPETKDDSPPAVETKPHAPDAPAADAPAAGAAGYEAEKVLREG